MNLGIIGSRTFDNYNTLKKVIQKHFITWDIDNIVSGGAKGADSLAMQYANEFNIKTKIYIPDWDTHGRSAGFVRNSDIWKNSDVVVAFWDGESQGTKHSFKLSSKFKKEFLVVEYLNKKIYWYTDPSNIITTNYYSKKVKENTTDNTTPLKITF